MEIQFSGLEFRHYKNQQKYKHIGEAKWGSILTSSLLSKEVYCKAEHTETGEIISVYQIGEVDHDSRLYYASDKEFGVLTIYQADYETEEFGHGYIWARPEEMFWGDVEIEYDEFVPRFRLTVMNGKSI